MENTINKGEDLNAWAEQEHRIRRHNELQVWGERLVPLLTSSATDLPDRTALFEMIVTSVERGDEDVAGLFLDLEATLLESTRSWYTEQLGHVSESSRINAAQCLFFALLNVYKAGSSQ